MVEKKIPLRGGSIHYRLRVIVDSFGLRRLPSGGILSSDNAKDGPSDFIEPNSRETDKQQGQ